MPILPPETAILSIKDYAEFHLTTTPESFLLNDDGVTYVKIPNMVLGLANSGFSVTTGTLKKVGRGGRFVVTGTSDLEVDKASTITYALVVDGTPVPSELTTHAFTNQDKLGNISITAIADLPLDAEVEIHAKCDGTLAVTMTVAKLDVTFQEV